MKPDSCQHEQFFEFDPPSPKDRIQICNKYKHEPTPNDVYIGRGSPFGNPYAWEEGTKAEFLVKDRAAAISAYESWFHKQRLNNVFMYEMLEIMFAAYVRGEKLNLVCYCEPKPCHGMVIKKYLEQRYLDIKKNQVDNS